VIEAASPTIALAVFSWQSGRVTKVGLWKRLQTTRLEAEEDDLARTRYGLGGCELPEY